MKKILDIFIGYIFIMVVITGSFFMDLFYEIHNLVRRKDGSR